MDKLEIKILHEELARAVMINEAKKLLSEEEFSYFINELREYDKNLPLNESVEAQLLYEGLLDRLKNLTRNIVKKIAPDDLEKIDQLAAQLADVDMELAAAKEVGRTPNEIKALETKMRALLKQLTDLDPAYGTKLGMEYVKELSNAEKELYKYGKGAFSQLTGAEAKDEAEAEANKEKKMDAATAEKAKEQLDDIDDQLDTPKSRSIWTSIKRNYMAAFEFMPALLGAGIRKLNQIGKAKPQSQDDMLLQLLMMLLQKSGANQNVDIEKVQKDNEDKSEEPIQGGEGGDDGAGKPKQNKVADVQDKIILALNKVLDLVDLDLSRRDTQELAKKLTKNLVDQMVANGISFKGMEAKVQETVLKAINNRLLTEQEEQEEEQKKKIDPLQKIVNTRAKRFGKTPSAFVSAAKELKRDFLTRGLSSKDVFKQYVNSEVEQEWLGVYGAFLDLKALRKAEAMMKKQAEENPQAKKALEQVAQLEFDIGGRKEKGRKIQTMISKYINLYKVAHNKNRDPNSPDEVKKYREMAKKARVMKAGSKQARDQYKPEKVPAAELPAAQKGQINARNLAFQALKGMDGIEKDMRTDIANKLTKKLVGIAKQYIEKGMEINVVQEKLDRYTKSVIKELKNAM